MLSRGAAGPRLSGPTASVATCNADPVFLVAWSRWGRLRGRGDPGHWSIRPRASAPRGSLSSGARASLAPSRPLHDLSDYYLFIAHMVRIGAGLAMLPPASRHLRWILEPSPPPVALALAAPDPAHGAPHVHLVMWSGTCPLYIWPWRCTPSHRTHLMIMPRRCCWVARAVAPPLASRALSDSSLPVRWPAMVSLDLLTCGQRPYPYLPARPGCGQPERSRRPHLGVLIIGSPVPRVPRGHLGSSSAGRPPAGGYIRVGPSRSAWPLRARRGSLPSDPRREGCRPIRRSAGPPAVHGDPPPVARPGSPCGAPGGDRVPLMSSSRRERHRPAWPVRPGPIPGVDPAAPRRLVIEMAPAHGLVAPRCSCHHRDAIRGTLARPSAVGAVRASCSSGRSSWSFSRCCWIPPSSPAHLVNGAPCFGGLIALSARAASLPSVERLPSTTRLLRGRLGSPRPPPSAATSAHAGRRARLPDFPLCAGACFRRTPGRRALGARWLGVRSWGCSSIWPGRASTPHSPPLPLS